MQFLARQADFDQLVTEFLKERGDSGGESFLTEAVEEAIESFESSHYDLSALFVYKSKAEFELKFSFEARCRALEAVVASQVSDANMLFCIQGMSHVIKDETKSGIFRIVESRNLISTILSILSIQKRSDEDSKDSNAIEDDDDDGEDENEDLSLERLALLELLTALFMKGEGVFREWTRQAILPDEKIAVICRIFDEEMTETKVVKVLLVLLFLLCKNLQENRSRFLDHSIVDLLNLCRKVNKNDEEIIAKVDRLVELFGAN